MRLVATLTALLGALLLSLSGAWAELPAPTFHWSFDDGMNPEVCAPGTEASVTGEPQSVPGRKGQALLVPSGATIGFPVAGHINPREGTVALWVKRTPPEGRPKYARLFDITGTTDPRTSLRLVYPTHTILYAEMSTQGTKYIPWPMGDAGVRGDEWQHLAVTWGPGGGTFYVNGVTLTSTSSMPELGDLPDVFYVGSEAAGDFSACAPIDELYIFDRALRSRELFELAGRTSPTDVAAPNLLRNSSFEVGKRPWQTFLWAAPKSTLRVVDDVAHSGSHSLLMDRSQEEHDWWSTTWLVGPWVHLQRDETVTLSAWVKADRPDMQIGLDIQRGSEGRAVQGVPAEAELRAYHSVRTEWRRVTLTGTLPISYKDGYRPRIHLVSKPGKLWIDDVQLTLGGASDYAPIAPLEFGLEPAEETTTYTVGSNAPVAVGVSNAGGEIVDATVQVSIQRPDSTVISQESFTITVPAEAGETVVLAPVRIDGPGHYVVTARIGNEQRTLTLAGLREPPDSGPRAGPFGVHGPGSDDVWRAGLTEYRDVSGLTWRWIERARGEWRYDDREASYRQALDQGLRGCATLADAPPWASQSNPDLVPDELDEWRRYVRTIVTNFAPTIDIWEIWNEPDLKQTFVQDPQRYVDILKAAREIQETVDPDSRLAGLCAAGVSDRVYEWSETCLKLGALEQMDLLAWHPYFQGTDGEFLGHLERMNQLMDKYGGRKPMIFTEFGTSGVSDWALHIPWAADGWRKYDEGEQAQRLVRQCVISLAEGAIKLYWYQWAEERIQVGPDTFGLVRADTYATPKLGLVAYSNMAWLLGSCALPPTRLEMTGENQWGYEFTTATGKVRVLWDAKGTSTVVRPAGARVIDLWGNELPDEPDITLSASPVYAILN